MTPTQSSSDVDKFVAADIANCVLGHVAINALMKSLDDMPYLPAGRELKLLMAKLLIHLKAEPPQITRTLYIDPVPHPKFWHALTAITVVGDIVRRIRATPDEARCIIICDALRQHWDILWQWVHCGVQRAWHLTRYPLPKRESDFLFRAVHYMMDILSSLDERYGLGDLLFVQGINTILDLWSFQTHHPELDQEFSGSPDRLVAQWILRTPGSKWSQLVSNCDVSGEELARLILARSTKLFAKKSNLIKNHVYLGHNVNFMGVVTECNIAWNYFTATGRDGPHPIGVFTRLLLRASEHASNTPLPTYICMVLAQSLDRMAGIDLLRQSIEAGLLLALLRSAPRSAGLQIPPLSLVVQILSK
ncbi:hypothetical protein H0H87_005334 [Tephrocybe sp. NHM501043]|nr:hypothetical protein H0H87_005334 [Tephrocybe sp. NHM501043]